MVDLSREALDRVVPGLTLTQIAKVAGLDLPYLSRMASGKQKIGQLATIKLERALRAAKRLHERGELPERKKIGRPRKVLDRQSISD